ncbi:MAG: hypothetical protein KF734_10095 [Saprospiraceae bacterium]|nr:hypothetical protein [Saprospiraceae bacterium]
MKHFALLLLFALNASCLAAQAEPVAPLTIFEQLTATEACELTLEADLTTLVGQKKTNNYLPGTLRTKDGKSYPLELRARGRYRRKVSQLAPMKVKFSKEDLRNAGLDTLNEIKIALPTTFTDVGNELIVKEYLAYRMFELVSDAHFRAKLVKLTLKDTNDKGSGTKKVFAIFIEDEEEVAHRIGGTPDGTFGVKIESLDQQQAALVVMFQYLIGNTDWDFSMHRNVELFMMPNGKRLALPYDFDFAGLVSAPYASPSSESGVKTVRDRYLMSSDVDSEALKTAIATLKSKEKEFYQLCRNKHLPRTASADMIGFLQYYFKNMEGKDAAPTVMAEKRE